MEEVIAKALGVVEDDDRDDAALVDERHERALDVGDDPAVDTGATNVVAVHGVPKTTRPVGARISLTFRRMAFAG